MLETLALFSGDPAPPRSEPRTNDRSNKLWIAAFFPRLSLESLTADHTDRAIVVTEALSGSLRVVAASDTAIAMGIEPPIELSAAYGLSNSLIVLTRRIEAERAKLESLAGLAARFTSIVSLEPPAALLLEVGGSLKLFGGIESIKNSFAALLHRHRVAAHLCAAPTSLAALWLARCGEGDVLSKERLVGSLSRVPVQATQWPQRIQALLNEMGVCTLGDCLRLPRDGFARRIGRQYLRELDQSRGDHDVRHAFEPPLELSAHHELDDDTVDVGLLANIGIRLIEGLIEDLRRRQLRVPYFDCVFHHSNRAKTIERVHFAEPTQNEDRFIRLFEDRLEQMGLSAPVGAVSLKLGGPAEPMNDSRRSLFGDLPNDGDSEPGHALIERLQARFGVESLHGMQLVDEHRPETAWIESRQFGRLERRPPLAVGRVLQRPLWLLPRPKRLARLAGNLPCYESEPLQLGHGPERIESGWWDGREVGRDYYIASSARGERLWVFQDRCMRRDWYLHGYFG